jgi:hypothetical protein
MGYWGITHYVVVATREPASGFDTRVAFCRLGFDKVWLILNFLIAGGFVHGADAYAPAFVPYRVYQICLKLNLE